MATIYFNPPHKIFSLKPDAGKKSFQTEVFKIYDPAIYAYNILIKSSDFTRICPNLESEFE
jgi:hypothetical protein